MLELKIMSILERNPLISCQTQPHACFKKYKLERILLQHNTKYVQIIDILLFSILFDGMQ
jgi:hypothetical protein